MDLATNFKNSFKNSFEPNKSHTFDHFPSVKYFQKY